MGDAPDPKTTTRPGLLVIGNFDGVHRGHQAMIAEAASLAEARGLRLRVLTFDPHPAEVLGREPPALLTNVARKRELLARASASLELVVQTFDKAYASQSPREFAERIVRSPTSAAMVIVGANFRFGKDRAGDLDTLRALGDELGFEARSHALVGDEEGPWSSTRVRRALATGDLETATRLLGRPHMVRGVVVRGDARGRTIGFPTANLGRVAETLPDNGVYSVLVDREEGTGAPRALGPGVANVGVRPTVDGTHAPRVEIHLFDRNDELYDATLRAHFIHRLRGEQRFAGLAELTAQIRQDADDARHRLAGSAPSPDAGGAYY